MDWSDDTLVEHIKQGDERAFKELVQRYQKSLYGLIFKMIGNHEDSMDLLQEVFLKVYKNIGTFEGKSSLHTWMYRIATNRSIDYLRSQKKRQSVAYDDGYRRKDEEEDYLLPRTLSSRPDQMVYRKELQKQIHNGLEKLSEKHRAIIILREIEGLSYSDIAQVLDISIGTVMSRLHHAKKNLQKFLQEYLQG